MPPKPPCPSVQAAVRWRACGEVRARAGNKPLMGRHYLGANAEAVAHEIGWHATYDHAEKLAAQVTTTC